MNDTRLRKPKIKDNTLELYWGRPYKNEPPEVMGQWGEGCSKRDLYLLFHCLLQDIPELGSMFGTGPSLVKQLEDRGYDVSTLKFSISKKDKQV